MDDKTIFSQWKIEKPITCKYEPLPDITAYELSRLLPYLLLAPLYKTDWERLGTATRHLKCLTPTVPAPAPK